MRKTKEIVEMDGYVLIKNVQFTRLLLVERKTVLILYKLPTLSDLILKMGIF